jgi:ribonucleoside-triphosphate reductase
LAQPLFILVVENTGHHRAGIKFVTCTQQSYCTGWLFRLIFDNFNLINLMTIQHHAPSPEQKVDPRTILGDITTFMKYARYLEGEGRRETWAEIVQRNADMHKAKFPQHANYIQEIYDKYVLTKKVLPSMRSAQFAGKAIEVTPNRIYNCAYLPVDDYHAFSESMFLLLGGTGVGYSVQRRHTEKLHPITHPEGWLPKKRFVISDDVEGWGDAVKVLFKAFMGFLSFDPVFDFSQIRPKGAQLVTAGGKAPGPEPLIKCLVHLRGLLESVPNGEQMSPLQVHDAMCYIADAVKAGGIRRAAMISLFDKDDEEMLTCKSGFFPWGGNPQRARANNSIVLKRGEVGEEEFKALWETIEGNGTGEPGFFWTNDEDWGTNPCCEIALKPYQFCNLTEINGATVIDQKDLNHRALAAAFIGTLQATYTDFHYLRPIWRETTENDALLGVSITGIASPGLLGCDLKEAAEIVNETNDTWADTFEINRASRTTCVKPAGTTSLVLGTSSGIHAWHNDYYIRRVRVGKNEAIYKYLAEFHPELVEDAVDAPEASAVISVPQNAPENAILRGENIMDFLARIKRVTEEWVQTGFRKGNNGHNVSATVNVKEGEWPEVGQWMWDNQNSYNGLAVFPFYDAGAHPQLPFEDCDEATFNKMVESLHRVDLTQVKEVGDNTDLAGEDACAGGACEI